MRSGSHKRARARVLKHRAAGIAALAERGFEGGGADFGAGAIASIIERAARLPSDAATRKAVPMVSGLLDYFPDALAEVAHVSKVGNEQHNPGQAMHWARNKSTDQADCILRHLVDRGGTDSDGLLHSAKVAWRALALLQEELEQSRGLPLPRGCK